MEFAVNCSSISINQFEGVWSISIHVAIAIGNATVTEQERHLKRGIKHYKWAQHIKEKFFTPDCLLC